MQQKIPQEIHIELLSYLKPNIMSAVNRYFNYMSKCNFIWGPIVYKKSSVTKSNNFFDWLDF